MFGGLEISGGKWRSSPRSSLQPDMNWRCAKEAASYITIIVDSDKKIFRPDYAVSGAWQGGPLFDELGHVVGTQTSSDPSGKAIFSRVNNMKRELFK